MACGTLSPCSPSRFNVQVLSRHCVSSCQCRQQRFVCSLSSRSSCFRRGSSASCRERKTRRGKIEIGGFVWLNPSRWKSRSIPASNFYGSATSSQYEIGFDNECRPPLKPAKNYAVREAKLDEELWAAAWIRAESYCEEQPYVRYVESYKKKFAEQEFDALKRRLIGKYGQSIRCICLVAVTGRSSQNSTMNGSRSSTVLERVVGTLDLSVRHLSQGEAFPGDSIRATLSMGALDVRGSHQYGYIANVCVTKAARQNGIGSSLLGTAINAGKDWGELHLICTGLKYLYVHVNSTNKAAQCLYNKFQFQHTDYLEDLLSEITPCQLRGPRQYSLRRKDTYTREPLELLLDLLLLVSPLNVTHFRLRREVLSIVCEGSMGNEIADTVLTCIRNLKWSLLNMHYSFSEVQQKLSAGRHALADCRPEFWSRPIKYKFYQFSLLKFC